MRNVMSLIKVILINILITFSLLGMLLIAPPVIYSVYSIISVNSSFSSPTDERYEIALYKNVPWAESHFIELSQIQTTYYDFITWRRDDYRGETINIIDGVRATIGSQAQINDTTQYFFLGGSTTWGTGVNDANTYPSLFAQQTNTRAQNFGESGYIARQSLAYLNNLIIQESKNDWSESHVVFYDGVNDVHNRCRAEISGLGTSREREIQNALQVAPYNKYSFTKSFEQLIEFLSAVKRKLANSNKLIAETYYNCHLDPERAQEVARTLVETWQAASDLVIQQGGDFTAILQPVAYLGNPNIDYLELTTNNDLVLAKQYEAVYPLIKQLAKTRNINFLDLTSTYDNCDNCYIDFCHVGPEGHQLLVSDLAQNLLR